MNIKIADKCDQESVNKIIAIGYPDNIQYMDQLLSWTCDPNWPIAGSIYQYFVSLGVAQVPSVLRTAEKADYDWRYTIITHIISSYDDKALAQCTKNLMTWAARTGSDECDFESIRILTDRALISAADIAKIAKRNLFVYNLWIKETMEAAGKAIYALPLSEHTL